MDPEILKYAVDDCSMRQELAPGQLKLLSNRLEEATSLLLELSTSAEGVADKAFGEGLKVSVDVNETSQAPGGIGELHAVSDRLFEAISRAQDQIERLKQL